MEKDANTLWKEQGLGLVGRLEKIAAMPFNGNGRREVMFEAAERIRDLEGRLTLIETERMLAVKAGNEARERARKAELALEKERNGGAPLRYFMERGK